MGTAARIAAGLALGLGLAACGALERAPVANTGAPRAVDAPEAAAPEALPPEIAKILLDGPGGPVMDTGFDLDLDLEDPRPRPLRIVLDTGRSGSAPSGGPTLLESGGAR